MLQEQSSEQARENPDREEESGLAGDPPLAVRGQAAAGDNAMQMRMMVQVLAPGVQHGEEADLGTQMLGICGDGAQGLGGGAEEKTVDERLVLIGNGGDGLRQREDDVKVLCVEEFGATILQPLCA